jgi:hypothetical protein
MLRRRDKEPQRLHAGIANRFRQMQAGLNTSMQRMAGETVVAVKVPVLRPEKWDFAHAMQ